MKSVFTGRWYDTSLDDVLHYDPPTAERREDLGNAANKTDLV